MRFHFLLPAALVACGHGETPPLPDCCIEPPPPIHGPARIHITNDGAPVAGVTVFYQDRESALIAAVVTDAGGFASADVQSDAFVTVIDPFGPLANDVTDVRTFAGVAAFDQLSLTGGTPPAQPPITITVSAPIEGTAAQYQLRTSCGNGTLARPGGTGAPTGQITLRGCGGALDLFLLTTEANGTPRRSIYRSNVAISDGMQLDLTEAYEPMRDVTFDFFCVGFDSVKTRSVLRSPRGLEHETTFTTVMTASETMVNVKLPNMLDGVRLVETRPVPLAGDLTEHGVFEAALPSQFQFMDLTSTLQPKVTSAPRFSPPRFLIWDEVAFVAASAALPDAPSFEGPPIDDNRSDYIVLELAIERGTKHWQWTMSAPNGSGFTTLPLLPIEVADLNVQSTDAIEPSALSLFNLPIGTYPLVRGRTLDTKNPKDLLSEGQLARIVLQELRTTP